MGPQNPAEPPAPHVPTPEELKTVTEVLHELYRLLEQYGPVWYTEAHRTGIERALAILRKS